jgi:hypothetical protein
VEVNHTVKKMTMVKKVQVVVLMLEVNQADH